MQFVFFNETYQPFIDRYQLVESQLRFTNHPQAAVKLASAIRTPILVLVEGKLVTYFDLHREEGVAPYSDNPHAILLRAFSTDVLEQGKGYAKQALQQLPGFVKKHFPTINEIVLAVNTENVVAQGLYKKCGFINYGERREGRMGEMIVMSYALES